MNAAKENPVNAATLLDACFAALKAEQRPALVTYVTAGDPDYESAVVPASARALLSRFDVRSAHFDVRFVHS